MARRDVPTRGVSMRSLIRKLFLCICLLIHLFSEQIRFYWFFDFFFLDEGKEYFTGARKCGSKRKKKGEDGWMKTRKNGKKKYKGRLRDESSRDDSV